MALSLAAVVAAPLAWMFGRALKSPVQPHAIAAPRRAFDATVGRLSFYEDDVVAGVPVVLLHGLSSASSAYEVRSLFEAFRGERPVVAPDLLGYGFSSRRSEGITREDHVRAIEELLSAVAARFGGPVDVVAVGLTGELAACAARAFPCVRSLALIAPTGFERGTAKLLRSMRHASWPVSQRLVRLPGASAVVHRLISSRWGVAAQLMSKTRRHVPEDVVRYTSSVAQQPRSRAGVLAALSGSFETDHPVEDLYNVPGVPTAFVRGDAQLIALEELERLVRTREQLTSVTIEESRGLPHIERAIETASALRDFHRRVPSRPHLRIIRGEGRARSTGVRRRTPLRMLRQA